MLTLSCQEEIPRGCRMRKCRSTYRGSGLRQVDRSLGKCRIIGLGLGRIAKEPTTSGMLFWTVGMERLIYSGWQGREIEMDKACSRFG